LPPTEDEVFTRPTRRWRVANSGAPQRTLETSYAITGLSWSADYTIVLGADETRADVSALAALTNQSGTRYDDAALVLIAGEVHRAEGTAPPQPVFGAKRAMTAAAAPEAARPAQAFAEHYRYAFDPRVAL